MMEVATLRVGALEVPVAVTKTPTRDAVVLELTDHDTGTIVVHIECLHPENLPKLQRLAQKVLTAGMG